MSLVTGRTTIYLGIPLDRQGCYNNDKFLTANCSEGTRAKLTGKIEAPKDGEWYLTISDKTNSGTIFTGHVKAGDTFTGREITIDANKDLVVSTDVKEGKEGTILIGKITLDLSSKIF